MSNGKDVVYFFLREYNDIDHITPLIDHICSRRRTIVKIFAVNNNKKVFSQNNNLLYIERSYGIKTIDLLSLCSKDKRYRVTEKCINRIQLLIGNNGIPILKDIIRVIGIKVIGVLHLSTQSIFRKFLFSQNTPNVCLFDIGTEYAYPYRLIHKIISKSNIPRICIHHGLITHLNRDFNIKQKILHSTSTGVSGYFKKYYQLLFTFMTRLSPLYASGYLVPGKHYALMRSVESGKAPRELVHEVASLRYTYAWNEVYSKSIYPVNKVNKSSSQGLKVVLMMISDRYNVNRNSIIQVINSLASLTWIDFTIKPFTRGDAVESYIESITKEKSIRLAPETSSLDLVRWSDVVIAYGSSIEFQPLLDDKPLIHLSFVDTNYTMFEKYNACWEVSSVNKLITALDSLYKNPKDLLYTQRSIDTLFNEVIYGGYSREDIFDRYRSCIEDISGANL